MKYKYGKIEVEVTATTQGYEGCILRVGDMAVYVSDTHGCCGATQLWHLSNGSIRHSSCKRLAAIIMDRKWLTTVANGSRNGSSDALRTCASKLLRSKIWFIDKDPAVNSSGGYKGLLYQMAEAHKKEGWVLHQAGRNVHGSKHANQLVIGEWCPPDMKVKDEAA